MHNSNIPTEQELPSSKQLFRSTILAAVVAAVLLVTVVMPAEYGIDPTGIGNLLGLKRMGEIKASLAEEAAADKAADARADTQPAAGAKSAPTQQSHEMQVTLAPDKGTEIKVSMDEGDIANYEWWTDGGEAVYDVHGDSGKLDISYHNYSKGTQQKMQGSIKAAFSGSHGWYWRNRTSETMTITLKTDGVYGSIREMK